MAASCFAVSVLLWVRFLAGSAGSTRNRKKLPTSTTSSVIAALRTFTDRVRARPDDWAAPVPRRSSAAARAPSSMTSATGATPARPPSRSCDAGGGRGHRADLVAAADVLVGQRRARAGRADAVVTPPGDLLVQVQPVLGVVR